MKSIVHTLSFEKTSWPSRASASSFWNASSSFPARRAARVTKYGGSSPIAVPTPQRTNAGHTRISWPRKVREPSPYVAASHVSLSGCWYTARKWVDWHLSAVVTTVMQNGKRNISPECSPLPKPIDESTPSTSHHAASLRISSGQKSAPSTA